MFRGAHFRCGNNLRKLIRPRKFFSSTSSNYAKNYQYDLSKFPAEKIRNFAIIAHVDHGKSTLSDRLLEISGVIKAGGDNKQVLDTLSVEKERGITVKAMTCSLFYNHKGEDYLLNLIDTPGHVDFHYEVSRSLGACQGVILVVDAAQGVQAQTLANFYLAFGADLEVVPVINKIDLPNADPDKVALQMRNTFDFEKEDIVFCSAKSGLGVEDILPAVIEKIPPPKIERVTEHMKAFLFDSWFTQYRGALMLIELMEGRVKAGDQIQSFATKQKFEVNEVGILHPGLVPTENLQAGQVGYIIANMKKPEEAKIGDTFFNPDHVGEPLPGFQEAKPMVFAGIFPVENATHTKMRDDIEKLLLQDNSVTVHPEHSLALGNGFRLGFLGTLHMEVFIQRLEEEYGANVITTAPSVSYKVIEKDGTETIIDNPGKFPESQDIQSALEPIVLGTIIFPEVYMGKFIALCEKKRGIQQECIFIDDERVMLKYQLPLSEIATEFYSEIKSISSGYASFDYEDAGYMECSLSKIRITINNTEVDVLATVADRIKANSVAKEICIKLKEALPRQLIDIAIQGKIGGKVIARESLKALRKDVTAKCYGGDVTRKMKLLNKQKEGKKRMKAIGNVEVPKEAFLTVLKK